MPPSFSSSTNAGFPMYKNHLQEYAQRSGMQIPCYNTANEGFAHAPKFRSTVSIDGKNFTSPQTFSTRKQAEQAAAKMALGSIERNTKEQAHPIIHQDPVIWKSILHEFAAKTNKDIPRYTTVTISDDKRPVFVSTIVFDGKSSTGDVGKSKKEAEQLVARAAVNSLESGSRNILNQIIQSKGKRYAGLTKIGNCSLSHSTRCIEDLSKHRNPTSPSSVKFNHTGSIGNSSDGRKRKFEDQNPAERRIVVMGRQS